MKNYDLTVICGEEQRILTADGEKTILAVLRENGFSLPEAPCGGHGSCGKCRVFVKGRVRSLQGEVTEANGELLACAFLPADDLKLCLSPSVTESVENRTIPAISGGGTGLGLAIDLGTTTVSAALYELSSGTLLGEVSALNAQRGFGADVVSRIEHCRKGNAGALFDLTARQLGSFFAEHADIGTMVIAGNTVMQHLAARLDPSPLAVPPFRVQSLFGDSGAAPFRPSAEVYFSPCVSAYVGGDVVAGMIACDLDIADDKVLYVDVGTNGEIAFGDCTGFEVCATAAGPAFEGAEISCGMRSGLGAIDRVWVSDGELCLHTVGDAEPVGICGSGLIDAMAALLELRLVGPSGRFINPGRAPEMLRHRFVERDGARAFALSEKVYLTSHDIHALLLAKAAIRAGIETLLRGRRAERLIVAGGFGSCLNVQNAAAIGLLPPMERTIQVGNSSLGGAALLLREEYRARAELLAKNCRYLDLSSSAEFYNTYLSDLKF